MKTEATHIDPIAHRRMNFPLALRSACLLFAVLPNVILAQQASPAVPQPANSAPAIAAQPISAPATPATSVPATQNPPQASAPGRDDKTAKDAKPDKLPRGRDRRRAVKLYLAASKLYLAQQFDEAMRAYLEAAALDPSNPDYPLAAGIARGHAVTALIQAAAKDRLSGNTTAARAALAHALELDPGNAQVTQHMYQLRDDALASQTRPIYQQTSNTVGEAVSLSPNAAVQSFHLHIDQRQTIQQVFRAYGLEATVDDSVRATPIRLDMDDATFAQAMRAITQLTDTFYVPLDAHRALVARDTRENRQQFTPQDMETIYLSGLTSAELTEVVTMAKNLFEAQQAVAEPTVGTITIRAPALTLNAFNATMRDLLDGRSQVMLDVRMIQIAHIGGRKTGVTPPQTLTAFNVYAEEQSILNANQDLVQQIIASGLAAPGDTLAILGILLASGQVTSSIFSNGAALFGGGLTQSALSFGGATANLNFNSSDSRELDQIQLHLGDGEEGTLRQGSRYPIQTSSYSASLGSVPNIPGLTSAGNSSGLSSLLSGLGGGGIPNVPQIEYQDLGLTLKATPRVMRNGDVALTVDLKINALAGSSINGNPILNNRAYSGVVTLKMGEGVVVVSELDKQESRAISGVPGLSEIPGLNNLTGKDVQKNYASLLIVITPHVIRGTQAAGHTRMMRVERNTPGR